MKIIALLTAIAKAIPVLKKLIEDWERLRRKVEVDRALEKVDRAEKKEDIKNAVIEASKKFNKK